VKLGFGPLDGERSPSQSIRGSDCTRVAKAVPNSRRVRGEAIGVCEISGQLEPGVLAELHEEAEIVSEGEGLIPIRNRCLQRLLDRLLGMEPNRRI
jgi:hypothetical protein